MARLFSVLARAGDALVDRQAADQLGEWLLEDAGSDAKRWAELAKRFGDFPPPMRKAYVTKLADFAAKQPSDADRAYLQNALRGLIHKQRKFIDAQWALPEEDLAELEAVYDALSPNDEIKKIEWLFEAYGIAQLHPPPARNFRAGEVSSNTERQRAIDQIVSRQGVSGILALIDKVKLPALVGKAVAEVAPAAMTDDLMLRGLRAGTDAGRNFAFGIIRASNQAAGPEWGLALLERARAEGWPDNTIVDILMSLPRSEAVLRASSTFGPDVERRYWSEAGMQWISAEDENIGWVAEKLIDFGRARDAIHLMGSHLDNVPNESILRALHAALREPDSGNSGDQNDAVMFQHYVQEIFQKLDKADDVAEEEVARLEWSYLAILEDTARPAKTLHQRLATNPQFFVELLSLLYRSNNESAENDLLAGEDQEKRANVANQAYRLLQSWRGMPRLAEGKVDERTLQSWVKEARALCAKSGRKEIGDQKIGETFAWAPADADGTWPCVAVRNLIEKVRSKDLETGVYIGVRNARGITTRSPLDGGSLERAEAAKYRSYAKPLRLEFPRTFAMLEQIAQSYDHDAQSHDDDVDRRQL